VRETVFVLKNRVIWTCLLLSVLLHLAGLYLTRDLWLDGLDAESFRARIARIPPQFKPRRISALPKQDTDAPRVEMEYLQTEQQAAEIREQDLRLEATAPKIETQEAPLVLREIGSGAKEEAPILDREKMISPSSLGLADSMGIASMDLLRLVDLARANKDHAAVIRDPASRRDLTGYVNFTQLRVYGAGSGRGALDAMSRYLRDHTRLLARVRDETYEYFLSENLLKDPVHFLFQGGGMTAYRDEVLTMFSQEEKALMGRYMREGGFLFIEGNNRYLREMASHLRTALGSEATLAPISTAHPIYHSFYEFGGGFPGEDKTRVAKVGSNPTWYYPTQNREDLLAAQQAVNFNPETIDSGEDAVPPPQGLWGVEYDGDLVAVLSDLGLQQNWMASFSADSDGTEPVTYALMAGTNVVVYALTRDSGMTPKLPPPAWMQGQKPEVALQEPQWERGTASYEIDTEELFADLDASLALVQAPIGSEVLGDLTIRLDGRYSLELFKRGYQGLLFHNLPAGPHWVELRYGGQTHQLEIDLKGGKVTTLTFALNRFAFVAQLRMQEQEEKVDLRRWSEAFDDLVFEEIYLAEDREWLEAGHSEPSAAP
jgi:hypothetical protein